MYDSVTNEVTLPHPHIPRASISPVRPTFAWHFLTREVNTWDGQRVRCFIKALVSVKKKRWVPLPAALSQLHSSKVKRSNSELQPDTPSWRTQRALPANCGVAPACNLKGGKAEVQTAERSLPATQARWHGGRFWPVAPLEFTCVTFVCITTRRANVSPGRDSAAYFQDIARVQNPASNHQRQHE